MFNWLFTPRLNLFDCWFNYAAAVAFLFNRINWIELIMILACGIVISSIMEKKAKS